MSVRKNYAIIFLLVRYLGTGIQLIYPIIDKGLQIMSVQRI